MEIGGSSPIKAPVVSLSKKLYPYCHIDERVVIQFLIENKT